MLKQKYLKYKNKYFNEKQKYLLNEKNNLMKGGRQTVMNNYTIF